jgi:hypothetical protein
LGTNPVRFYLDENLQLVVADQLRKRGISVVTAHDLGLLGASDLVHFRRAAEMGAVICTHDADFLILAAQGHHHAGIAFGQQDQHTIGDWVSFLTLIMVCILPRI